MNKSLVVVALIGALGVGGAGGYWLASNQGSMKMAAPTSIPAEREALFWRNPMNPAITSPVFTKDEMGMDYLPVYANDNSSDEVPGTVTIDPVTVQNIGVRTVKAEQRALSRVLNGLGRVDFNEERLARLHPKTSGWIGTLMVNETGKKINKDTILLGIYSPELVAAQQEYLVALNNWESVRNSTSSQMKKSAKTVMESARQRLQLFDVPMHQLNELDKSRQIKKQLHIHSPFEGRVMNIGVREGQYVTPKDELYLVADLTQIWVNVDVFEDELGWLKVGDRAEMSVRAQPGRSYAGKITFIHPALNRKSRTAQIRLEFDNRDLSLKPGMFANVTLYVDAQPNAVVVPSEAIVRSGSREQVFVVRAPGKFEPREVTPGISAEGLTQILSGVQAGEQVVTSSQFLIDSESKLREATAKMMRAEMPDAGMADMPEMNDRHEMQEMHEMHEMQEMHRTHDKHDMDGVPEVYQMPEQYQMSDQHEMPAMKPGMSEMEMGTTGHHHDH